MLSLKPRKLKFIERSSTITPISEYLNPKELAVFMLVCKRTYLTIKESPHILMKVNPY